jgi:hypothetical protein
VAGAGHEDHVEVVLLDEAVQVRVDEGQPGAGAPVAQQTILDMFGAQRLLEQGIFDQVDHPQGEIATGLPISVDEAQFVGGERISRDGGPRGPVSTEGEIGCGFDRSHVPLSLRGDDGTVTISTGSPG